MLADEGEDLQTRRSRALSSALQPIVEICRGDIPGADSAQEGTLKFSRAPPSAWGKCMRSSRNTVVRNGSVFPCHSVTERHMKAGRKY